MKKLKLQAKFILVLAVMVILLVISLIFVVNEMNHVGKLEGIPSEVFEELDHAKMLIVVLFSGSIVIGVVLNFLMSRSVVMKVKRINETAEKIALGDIDVQLDTKGVDEVDDLGRTFGKVIDGIKQQVAVTEAIAGGNTGISITVRSDKDVLNIKMQQMAETIQGMLMDVNSTVDQIAIGLLDKRVDVSQYDGDWKELVNGINRLMNTITGWFDQMPLLLMFADKEYSVRYMNATAVNLLGETKTSVVSRKCHGFFCTDDCQSDKCACSQAMKSETMVNEETIAHLAIGDVDINYTGMPLYNGEGILDGFFEVVLDQTAVKTAERRALKQSDYQNNEVAKLQEELVNLSQGMLQMNARTEASDSDTAEIAGVFDQIYGSLEESIVSIKSYIQEMSDILVDMSDGDLTKQIEREYKGDFVQIKEAINLIVTSLNRVLGEIGDASEQVSLGSKQVADSAQVLSRGASDQASSVEEITSSMTEISEQTTQNAGSAEKANQIALVAKEDAIRGNQQMQQTLAAMNDINNSSASISKIIKVIDDIAFQTNILALNAAVEAARAGEHGKGFAVVAEEVRNLAARSASAAKETTDMIENSIQKAEDGTVIANQTAEALDKIVSGVTEAADIVDGIAKASKEQAIAINQINQGIEQIARVTQTNTATAEESASASEELLSQSELTQEMISQFKLMNGKSSGGTYNQLKKKSKKKTVHLRDEQLDDDIINLDSDEFGKF